MIKDEFKGSEQLIVLFADELVNGVFISGKFVAIITIHFMAYCGNLN